MELPERPGPLPFSRVGVGGWEAGGAEWGPNRSDAQVLRAILAGIDAGSTWVDTAEVYGEGRSEELVGRAIRARSRVAVSTKVAPRPLGTGFRAPEVRRACEGSLRRLGVEVVDLYQLHHPGPDGAPIEETWEAMALLVEDGLVRRIGLSGFGRGLVARCVRVHPVASLQVHLSLLHPETLPVLSWCADRGIEGLAFGALGFGLLAGAGEIFFDWRSGSDLPYYRQLFTPSRLQRCLAVSRGVGESAARLGVSPSRLSLAWALHQPGVSAVLAGTRDPSHARENAAAAEVELDAAVLAELWALAERGPAFEGAAPEVRLGLPADRAAEHPETLALQLDGGTGPQELPEVETASASERSRAVHVAGPDVFSSRDVRDHLREAPA